MRIVDARCTAFAGARPCRGDDIWAIVQDELMHFDGVSSQDLTPAPRVDSVAIAAHNDVWAASHDALWHSTAPPGRERVACPARSRSQAHCGQGSTCEHRGVI